MAAIVILDACVLFPAPLRDLLIRLAAAGLTRARWTEEILDECFRNIHAKRPELNERALTRTRELMNQAVRDPLVRGFEELIHDLTLPDSKDRHVLAAAIAAGAEAIVTFNLRDFPKDQLNAFGIVAVHPDEVVAGLLLTASGSVAEVITEQAVALRNPPRTVRELLDTLRAQGLVRAVPAIADVMGLRNRADNAETGKPLVAMSEIELHSAMDEIVLPLDESQWRC
jgi:predicted nucleic acid-binding protein